MTRKQRRLALIGVAGSVLAVAVALVLTALDDTVVFFRTPSELAARQIEPGTRMRIGGLVQDASLRRERDAVVHFVVTDGGADMPVTYRGILPDLFREGQGVVAEGVLGQDGTFLAETVLAKHDENYMPREVADALKAQGRWKEGEDVQ